MPEVYCQKERGEVGSRLINRPQRERAFVWHAHVLAKTGWLDSVEIFSRGARSGWRASSVYEPCSMLPQMLP
jgi:hypothetical protein